MRYDLAALRARIGDRLLVSSTSGGKDSTATGLYLRELGLPFERVHFLTGWDHPKLLHYVLPRVVAREEILKYPGWAEAGVDGFLDEMDERYGGAEPLARALGPITIIRPPLSLPDLVVKKGMFMSRVTRFCTEELKIFPFQRWCQAVIDGGREIVNVIGIRAEESAERAKFPEWDEMRWRRRKDAETPGDGDQFEVEVWRAILDWSEAQVIEMHQRHALKPCALYLDENVSRVGCYPCIFARKGEIKGIAEHAPWRIAHIGVLEQRVGELAQARAEAKGEARVHSLPTFFQAPIGRKRVPCGCKDGRCCKCAPPAACKHCGGSGACDGKRTKIHHVGEYWPIARVVAWARTARGGRQFELFAAGGDSGCVRWAMCDTGRPE